jgi:DNA invertase Pin-like site-specific DNA recombinase
MLNLLDSIAEFERGVILERQAVAEELNISVRSVFRILREPLSSATLSQKWSKYFRPPYESVVYVLI